MTRNRMCARFRAAGDPLSDWHAGKGSSFEQGWDPCSNRAQFISNLADMMRYNAARKAHNGTHPA